MKKPVVLRIYKGDQLLLVKQFLDQQIVIGRPGEVNVAFESESVSIIHASIEEREGAYFVSDLGSETGTLKNGQPVLDAQLESGDTIQVGEFKIEFYIGAPRPKSANGESTQITTVTSISIPQTPPPTLSQPEPKEEESKTDISVPVSLVAEPVEEKTAATVVDTQTQPSIEITNAKDEVVDLAPPESVKPAEPVTPPAPPPAPKAPEPPAVPHLQAVPAAPPAQAAPQVEAATPVEEAKAPVVPVAPPVVAPPAPPPQATMPAEQPAVKSPTPPPVAPPKLGFGLPKAIPTKEESKPTPPPSVPLEQRSGAAAASPAAKSAANRSETGSAGSLGMGGGVAALGSMTSAPLVGPKSRGPSARGPVSSKHGKKKRRKTFAPPSKHQDVRDYIKPSKGTVVEILVAWRERVISTHHFSQAKTITIGSHPSNDIVLPLFTANVRKLPIVKIERQALVLANQDMRGELVRGQTSSSFAELFRQNRMVKAGAGLAIALEQGEMIKIEMSDGVSVIVRYTSDSPKPVGAPLLDFTATETAGVVLAFALVATLWLYMYLYTPPKALAEDGTDEPIRTAMIVMTPPTPPPLPPPPPEEPKPTPPPVVATPPPQVVKVKVAEKTVEAKTAPAKPKAATSLNLTTKNDPGKSANAAPNKNTKGPRTLTSPKQGGAIKTADKEGSQMQSKSRDVSKMGVFSAFGSGGQQDQLAQSTTGSGELAGLASAATGKAGSAVNRPGQGLGSELKDTGVGGTGESLEGIAGGVGTTGRGSGNTGYGTGGLGNRAGVKIVTGGTGEVISGTIDREAIRRVILANLRVIRACYEKELNRKPDLFGKLVLGWDIGEQGRVVGTRVKSNELGSREVADCIMEKLKTWRFPEPPANQVVEIEAYPFLFSN